MKKKKAKKILKKFEKWSKKHGTTCKCQYCQPTDLAS